MKNLGKQIVVVDNGFVHVGECRLADGMLTIEDCRNVRKWGTTQGIGELINGPLKGTQADTCGLVMVPLGRVVFFIRVAGGW